MARHVAILGFLHAIFGALGVLAGLVVMIFGLGGGLMAWLGGGDGSGPIAALLATLGSSIGLIALASGGIGLLTGLGILGRRAWGRFLGIVLSALNLFNFPLGTLIGGYGLWVLLSDAGAAEFRRPR